jgi:tRNA pseudouridine65 synthase
MVLEILYRDNRLVAVNKPHGLLVHPSAIARDAKAFALQLLRDQIGRRVYPIHRLDRKTGGVMLFALDEEMHKKMQLQFAERKVVKKYLAIVRGYTEDQITIDYELKSDKGKLQNAITTVKTLDKVELNIPFGKHRTSRYSLIEAEPKTGRTHQIRRHLAHINHPIIADRPHGDNKQNKLFKERFGLMTMMLHAKQLSFHHPDNGTIKNISAGLHGEFKRMLEVLGFGKES